MNFLEPAKAVRKFLPTTGQRRAGLVSKSVCDEAQFVHSSVHEIIVPLVGSMAITTVVILALLRTLRAIVARSAAMLFPLMGTFFFMPY